MIKRTINNNLRTLLSLLMICSLLLGILGAPPVFAAPSFEQGSAGLSAAALQNKCLDAEGLKQQKNPHNDKLRFVGAKSGKPREKFTDVREMLALLA